MLTRILKATGWAILGAVAALLLLYVQLMRSMPDLQPWHDDALASEFRATDADQGWEGYLAHEEAVFEELRQGLSSLDNTSPLTRFSRYNATGPLNPTRFSRNWNRTYEHAPANPVGGALLIHGLSDSPYSTRAMGELFQRRGYHVIGLRVPGHGTTPGALTGSNQHDWRAAVRLAAERLAQQVGRERPLILGGYSNGAALAVEYTLTSLGDASLPQVSQLVLVSPALSVSSVAALARFQRRLAVLPLLEKLAWTSIQPEYDPYKYNSFPVAAGEQIYDLTSNLDARLAEAASSGGLKGFPPVLAFQSIVDSTVPVRGVVDRLLTRLPANNSELVLFDVNRRSGVEAFLSPAHDRLLADLQTRPGVQFTLTVVTNRSEASGEIVARSRTPGTDTWTEADLEMAWPQGVYSLSHVALPFSPTDPLYGDGSQTAPAGPIQLGNLQLRGESKVFGVSMDQLMRLRNNPFFPYLEARIEQRLDTLAGSR